MLWGTPVQTAQAWAGIAGHKRVKLLARDRNPIDAGIAELGCSEPGSLLEELRNSSKTVAMASNPVAMASDLLAMASNLLAIALHTCQGPFFGALRARPDS